MHRDVHRGSHEVDLGVGLGHLLREEHLASAARGDEREEVVELAEDDPGVIIIRVFRVVVVTGSHTTAFAW